MPHSVLKLLSCWQSRASPQDHDIIWNAIPWCLMWLILEGAELSGFRRCGTPYSVAEDASSSDST